MPVAGPFLIKVFINQNLAVPLDNESTLPLDRASSWKNIEFAEEYSATGFGTGFDGDYLSGHSINGRVSPSVSVLPSSTTDACRYSFELLDNGDEIVTRQLFPKNAQRDSDMNERSGSPIRRQDIVGNPQLETPGRSSPGCGVDVSTECSNSHLLPPEIEDNLDQFLITSREDTERSGLDAGDWVCSLAGLNSNLFNHKKAMSGFIKSFRCSVLSSSQRPHVHMGLESSDRWTNSTQVQETSGFCPVDDTFCLE